MNTADEAARLEQESRRGEAAARILGDALFVEAKKRIEGDLAELRRRVGLGDSMMHTKLIMMEQISGRFFDFFEELVLTGKMADKVIVERRSAYERMREQVKRVTQMGRNAF